MADFTDEEINSALVRKAWQPNKKIEIKDYDSNFFVIFGLLCFISVTISLLLFVFISPTFYVVTWTIIGVEFIAFIIQTIFHRRFMKSMEERIELIKENINKLKGGLK